VVTIKYNSNGISQWNKRYNSPYGSHDYGKSIAVDNLGFVYIGGDSYNGNKANDFLVLKYNTSTGALVMSKTYHHADDRLDLLKLDNNGNIYQVGISLLRSGSSILILKYNTSGQLLWTTTYHGNSIGNGANSMDIDGSGNLIVSGYRVNASGVKDYITLKYNPSGSLLWSRIVQTSLSSFPDSKVCHDQNNNIYLYGEWTSPANSKDLLIVKYSPEGNFDWFFSYDGPDHKTEYVGDILLDGGYIYITGTSMTANQSEDAVTIKYSEGSSRPTDIETPSKYSLSQNYPNPFNPSTNIKFDIPKASFVKLSVYDVSGREVTSMINSELQTGHYEYTFDGSKLTGGVYFYKLQAGDFVETKKMILVK
jgi:Secretion system C-terminal sorting domain/Beta-propeller repeat